MSIPIRAPLWIIFLGGLVNHLLSEQVDHEQGCVAFRAVTAQTDGARKEMALGAAPLADETFATSEHRRPFAPAPRGAAEVPDVGPSDRAGSFGGAGEKRVAGGPAQ